MNNILNAFVTKGTSGLNFAESKCLHLTSYIIKVILVGCFGCNDASVQSTNLMRRMSSNLNEDTEEVIPSLLRKKSSTLKQEIKKPEEKSYRSENIGMLVQLLEKAEPLGLSDDLLENLNKE